VNQEEVGSGSESINGFLDGFLDGLELGGQVYPSAAPLKKWCGLSLTSLLLPSWVEAWFTVNVR